MKRLVDAFFKLLEHILVFLMAIMTVMVFGNVVARYVFNTGLDISDELSRFAFVWMTFIGAVVAMRIDGHLGFDTLVNTMSPKARTFCLAAADIVIIAGCGVLFSGAVMQFEVNASDRAPVTGISMIWVNGVGLFMSAAIAIMTVLRLLGRIGAALRGDWDAAAPAPQRGEHAL